MTREKSGYYCIKYMTVVVTSLSTSTIAKHADESMTVSDVKPAAVTQRWTKMFLEYIMERSRVQFGVSYGPCSSI